jgi:MFS family permease
MTAQGGASFQPAPSEGVQLTATPGGLAVPPPAGFQAVPGARLALTLLVCINLFNYVDRQVLAAVEPEIQEHFFPKEPDANGKLKEPENAEFWMGMLPTAFLFTYMLTAPVFGWLANRMSRWALIGIGVILWSVASGGSGLAPLFLVLVVTRCFVGVGEAAYGPVAPDMISDLYPERKRGQVLAWFYTAIPFGGALGYAIGKGVEILAHDWRIPFYAVVLPGLLLGVWCFLMREPRRGQCDEIPGTAPVIRRRERLADYLILLRTPSYVLNTLGMTAMTFAMGGLAYWVPKYLQFRGVETLWGINAVIVFGGATALTGLVSTLLGGMVGDWLRPRFSGSYFLVSGSAMVLAFPMLLLMIWLPFDWAWIPLVLFVFFLFFNTGPTNTILANVTHPMLRAPGFALNILVIHILGDAASPPLMGMIAGIFRSERAFLGLHYLDVAFLMVSFMVLLGGILWLCGTYYLERDTRRAPFSLQD